MARRYSDLEERLGYRFTDAGLLQTALTHSSYVREQPRAGQSNERLEFLGDAFFDAIIGEELYRLFPKKEEGFLSRVRATIVCEPSLAEQAEHLDLGSFLLMGNGEDRNGGRKRPSILADALEAVMGAIYLDGGFDAVSRTVLRLFRSVIDDTTRGKYLVHDYKTALQEKLQAEGQTDICYEMLSQSGPDHDKTFTCGVFVGGQLKAQGTGKSKKQAEQMAAKELLKKETENAL